MAKHGNWPIFSAEFGKMSYILADLGKQEYCRTRKFCILKDGIRQSSNPTDTEYCLNSSVTLCQRVNIFLVPKSDQ